MKFKATHVLEPTFKLEIELTLSEVDHLRDPLIRIHTRGDADLPFYYKGKAGSREKEIAKALDRELAAAAAKARTERHNKDLRNVL